MDVISKEAESRVDWSHSPTNVWSPAIEDLRIFEVRYNKGNTQSEKDKLL
jgi:hypothetical protein